MSISEEFRDFILKRNHYLYRFENGAIKDMLQPMRTALIETKLKLDVLSQFGTGYTLDFRMQRLNQQISEIEALIQAASYDSAGILQEKIYQVVMSDGAAIEKMLASKYGKIGIDIVGLPFLHIDYIVNNPLLAQSIGSKLASAGTTSINNIRAGLTQSIIQGEDIRRATNRLIGPVTTAFANPAYAPTRLVKGSMERTIRDRAERIARSEILYASNQVARDIYRRNRDVLEGVQFSAALDRRTCLECASLDGTTYNYTEGGEDHTGPALPLHVHCRCVYFPITLSWKELEKQAGVKQDVSLKTKGAFINTTANIMTYNDWLKTLSADEVKDILGPSRYKLWKSGEIKLSQMATSNKILTIDELNDL